MEQEIKDKIEKALILCKNLNNPCRPLTNEEIRMHLEFDKIIERVSLSSNITEKDLQIVINY